MKRYFITAIFLISVFFIFGQPDKKNLNDFNQAKNYYINKKYNDALKLYLKIYNNGYDNFEINYNIGCCYYNLSQFGYSRFYFEKALFYKPFDKDLFFNLNAVYKKVLNNTMLGEQVIMYKRIIFFIPISAVIIILIILTLASLILCVLALTKVKYKKMYFINFCVLIIFIFSFFILYYVQYNDYDTKFFIITSKEANVYLAPNIQESILTSVSEGTRGKILEESNDYVRVALTDNMNGWIKKDNIIY